MFFENREAPVPPVEKEIDSSPGYRSEVYVERHVCYICLRTVDYKRERGFKCRNLVFCEFCPPLETAERLFPACGECVTEGVIKELNVV